MFILISFLFYLIVQFTISVTYLNLIKNKINQLNEIRNF
jgi:hypothetical protein